MRWRIPGAVAPGLALLAVAVAATVLYYFRELREGVFAIFRATARVLEFLGVGLVPVLAAVLWLYRWLRGRLRRLVPRVVPPNHAFRVGTWHPDVDFILADGLDLEAPRLLGPDEIECREAASTFALPPELAPHREAVIRAYSRRTLCRLTDGQIVRLEGFSLLRTPGDEHPGWLLEFSPLSFTLRDLPLCAAVLVHGRWIPASAVAVCLALLRRHGYAAVEVALSRARRDLYRRWLAAGEDRRRARKARSG